MWRRDVPAALALVAAVLTFATVACGEDESGGGAALPPPAPGERLAGLATFVEGHPEALVGLYVDGGTPVVVFGPAVDPEQWRGRLDEAAAGTPYRTAACGRSRAELRRVEREVIAREWTERGRAVPVATFVDAQSCSVRLTAELTPAEEEAIRERFGAAVTIERGRPVRR
jgi:hypothetical protein